MNLTFNHKNIDETRFPVLFGSIVLFLVGISVFESKDDTILVNILVTIFLGACVFTVSGDRKLRFAAISSGALFLFLRFLSQSIVDNRNLVTSFSVLFLVVFCALIFNVILKYILHSQRITKDVILGVISGYLLIGILFSFIFLFLFSLEPTHTLNMAADPIPQFSDFIYYSMITLSTVGYGDVLPLSDYAKLASYSLGIFGQLYVGIVMALIIGKFLNSKNKED